LQSIFIPSKIYLQTRFKMAYPIQYDLFEANDEEWLLKKELELVKKELTNVRKGMFAQLNSMKKDFIEKFSRQQDELDDLKKKLNMKEKVLEFPTPRSKIC